jgi:mannan endo-1,4-beta-mannosidase
MNLSRRSILVWLILIPLGIVSAQSRFDHFVTRQGDMLFDGVRPLRFISFNIPNLHYVEDYLPFEGTSPFRFPDAYEIRDAVTSIRQLGGKVTRMYVLSVRRPDDAADIPRHVEAPGVFNERAFLTLDTVMAIANEVGIRVIIPFVDNWPWWGGIREYAGFRGKPKEAFWDDQDIINDFKSTVRFLVTRRNTVTGELYKDDKALLGWETGNELDSPFPWTHEIAAYIKALDQNHLVIEGTHASELTEEALADSNIDVVTTHHYGDPSTSLRRIVENRELARGRKPYLVGEYGIVAFPDIRAITDTIINQGLVGGMIWSLRPHAREGGFYNHYEYNNAAAFHWPGSVSGDPYRERLVVNFLRDRAYRIDAELPPREEAPYTPVLLPIAHPSRISWQGSVGAATYRVERREDGGEWMIVGENVDESLSPYRPPFSDTSAVAGHEYEYRIRAVNDAGESDWSNVVGPVLVEQNILVDELRDYSLIFQKEGALRLLSMEEIRKAKEDRDRLTGSPGSAIIYRLPGDVTSIRVEWLRAGSEAGVAIQISRDGRVFDSLATVPDQVFAFPSNEYGFYDAVATTASLPTAGIHYVRLVLSGHTQVGRIEIGYGRAD